MLGGLLGCVCIATGFVFFAEKRKASHARTGHQGSRAVDALAVSAVTGLLAAAVGMLVFNRVEPADTANKGDWEKLAFRGSWVLALVHPSLRSRPASPAAMSPAWREQCWALAALSVAAVVLNGLTTGDHLIRTWPPGRSQAEDDRQQDRVGQGRGQVPRRVRSYAVTPGASVITGLARVFFVF